MNRLLYHDALAAVKEKLKIKYPVKYAELQARISTLALANSNDRSGPYYASIEWPAQGDYFSSVNLEFCQLPKDEGDTNCLEVTFSREDPVDAARVITLLKIRYALVGVLLRPVDAHIFESVEGKEGNITEIPSSLVTPDDAANILKKFGIVEV